MSAGHVTCRLSCLLLTFQSSQAPLPLTVWSKISVCVSNSSSCVAAIFSACCAIAHAISQLALTRDFSCRALGKMRCGQAGQLMFSCIRRWVKSMLTKRSSSWWEGGFLKTGVSPYTTELLWSWTCGSEIGPKILRHPRVVAQICSMLRKTSSPEPKPETLCSQFSAESLCVREVVFGV